MSMLPVEPDRPTAKARWIGTVEATDSDAAIKQAAGNSASRT